MKRRILAVVVAATMALLGLGAGISAAQAAGPEGYNSTPKNADGSLDFSGWTPVTAFYGDVLGTLNFTRNGINYTVTSRAPDGRILLFNTITNNDTAEDWTYAYTHGSGITSYLWWTDTTGRYRLDSIPEQYYIKTLADGYAIAVVLTVMIDNTEFLYSEVLDVTNEGRLIHHLTYTNTTGQTIPGISFSANLDTMLNSNDAIPIYAGGINTVYIENAQFRLYLDMLNGAEMLAGDWDNTDTLLGYQNVNYFSEDDIIVNGVDSDVNYSTIRADFLPGTSRTLSFEERLLAPEETVAQYAHVIYVDDDASGAEVTPVAGTPVDLVGLPGEATGYTEAVAQSGVPANYEFVGIDDVEYFDMDPDTDQYITVHLAHKHSLETMTTTRTIIYVGGGSLAPVVQEQLWVIDTDLVTGVILYYSAAGYEAVASPVVANLQVDLAVVVATAAGGPQSTLPTNTTVTVNYSPTVAVLTGGSVVAGDGPIAIMAIVIAMAAALAVLVVRAGRHDITASRG